MMGQSGRLAPALPGAAWAVGRAGPDGARCWSLRFPRRSGRRHASRLINDLLNWLARDGAGRLADAPLGHKVQLIPSRCNKKKKNNTRPGMEGKIVGRYGDAATAYTSELSRWPVHPANVNPVLTFGGGVNGDPALISSRPAGPRAFPGAALTLPA